MICELLTNFEMAFSGGEGIRTLDTLSSIHTFQACQFNHSCTPPLGCENTIKSPNGSKVKRHFEPPFKDKNPPPANRQLLVQ